MFRKTIACLLAAASCLALAAIPSIAAEVDSDSVYCFSSGDFSQLEEEITGVCILELPDADAGTVMLGTRVVRPGDIFTAQQLQQMTFCPVRTQQDKVATVGYLPIYKDRVENSAMMTISIRGKEDKAPVAKDLKLETYKNIPNEGTLKVSDPEGQQLTYTVTRQPRRGSVAVRSDGTFTYTPAKNKVGVDSFTFTAADPAGNVSGEATVTIQILKPTDKAQYKDTVGLECRFEAEWLRNTGLFAGEKVGGRECFQPEKEVSKGQFLAMLLETLDVPTENSTYTALSEQAPQWLKPYLAAAVRSGLIPEDAESFAFDASITEGEAAVMLQTVLGLSVPTAAAELSGEELALAVMAEQGIPLREGMPLTRARAACILYQVSCLSA